MNGHIDKENVKAIIKGFGKELAKKENLGLIFLLTAILTRSMNSCTPDLKLYEGGVDSKLRSILNICHYELTRTWFSPPFCSGFHFLFPNFHSLLIIHLKI